MSIPTPACTPAARPDPVPRAASPAGAGLWIAPAVWKTRTIRSRLNAPASRRVSHTALDGTERRPHAPQARSLYSSNTTSRVGLVHPLRIRWEKTDRPTSLRSDERSRSPESVFTIPGFGVQLHRNAQKTQGRIPRRLITGQLRSYAAACRTVMPSVVHVTDQYANNRAEVSHQPTRQRERRMRRFTSAAHVQRRRPARAAVCRIPCLIPCLAYVERTRMARPGSDLLEVPGGVLVQQARDQGLVR